MVGIVLVSHSRALAESVQELVRSMTGPSLPLAIAAGAGENHKELGTDAVEIAEAIVSVKGPDGVLVLMDMGSAILSSETALDLLDEPVRRNVRFCAAPFVEGAVASGVTANLGAPLEEVYAEALASLKQKESALNGHYPTPEAPPVTVEKNGHANKAAETIRVTVRNEHGLHARPAAQLIKEMRPFHAEITVRNVSNKRGPVSVKSLSGLASLEILRGNEIEFAASGDDAQGALEKIATLVENGLGDDLAAEAKSSPAKRAPASPPVLRKTTSGPIGIGGGFAIGRATYLGAAKVAVPQHKAGDIAAEIERLRTAVASAEKALEARRDEMTASVGEKDAGIYDAQMIALQDPELVDSAEGFIRAEGANAALAWDRANREIVARYEALSDPYLRERAADLEDVGRQVLELLVGKAARSLPTEPGILIADNFTPQEVSQLNPKLVRGVILLDGGATAHSSILLRALGLPAVAQARSVFLNVDLTRPVPVALDGATGQIWLDPSADFIADLEARHADQRKREEEERRASVLPAATSDGHAVEIFANIGDVSEVDAALSHGAEGVGLLRTEFLFLDRAEAPTEEEQYAALRAIADKMKGKPLIVRTLDAGGDKSLPYLHMPGEDNPFLGVRAIRLSFSHEAIFDAQLRAILRAGHERDVRIMFPMIASLADLDRATECLEKVHRELEKENVPHLWPVKTGIMIEIPSAALLAEAMARQADFFSIGTNDLTQYTMAADRGNPGLASYHDALHPSVLRLISMVVDGARKHDRLVAVCGEAASDERSAAVFVGLGVQELSLSSAKIPHIKACLRRQSFTGLQKLAYSALHCHTAAEVRSLKPAA
jgi:multiphosphoryl transfer protein